MKIGKYPVKHSYKVARIVSDVFSLGLAVFICSVEYMFMSVYSDTLTSYIGEENLAKFTETDPSLPWKHWLTLIFPAAVLAVFVVYVILVLTSHRLSGLSINKRNAQKVYDMYTLCVSLCKIPALMFINEMMMITHNKMLLSDESWVSVQLALDLVIIALLICVFRHLMIKVTTPEPSAPETGAVRVKTVARPAGQESPAPAGDDKINDTERN